MTRVRIPTLRLATVALVACLHGCGSSETDDHFVDAQPNQLPSLAADPQAAGWIAKTFPREFVDDAMFDYLGLDLEVYREYGCHTIKVQDFENRFGDLVKVEVFHAHKPLGAYGMFSLRTVPGGERCDVGDVGWYHDDRLHFCRGTTAVSLTAEHSTAVRVRGLENLAVAVDQALGQGAAEPKIFRLLPTEGLLPQGITYVAGPAGVRKVSKKVPVKFEPPQHAVIGRYSAVGGGHRLFVMRYPDDARAAAAVKAIAGDGIVLFPRHVLAVIQQERHVFAYYGPRDLERAKVALSRAVRRFKEAGGDTAEPDLRR